MTSNILPKMWIQFTGTRIMKKTAFLIVAILLIGLTAGYAQNQEIADLVVNNGKIFTVADMNSFVQAVAVKDGKILAVGTSEALEKYIGQTTNVLDVGGKLVIPGFIDAHCHFSSGGHSLSMLDVGNASSIAAIQKQIAAKIEDVDEAGEIKGDTGSAASPAVVGSTGDEQMDNDVDSLQKPPQKNKRGKKK